VAEIRSSTSGIAHHTGDSEKLCERISAAMERWDAVCKAVDSTPATVGNWLLTSDKFRLCIDNILRKMDDVRDDIVDLDVGRDVLHQTVDEKQARLLQLRVCRSISVITFVQ